MSLYLALSAVLAATLTVLAHLAAAGHHFGQVVIFLAAVIYGQALLASIAGWLFTGSPALARWAATFILSPVAVAAALYLIHLARVA